MGAELDTKLDLGSLGSAELDLLIGKAVAKAMTPPDRQTLWRALGAPLVKRVDVSGTVTAAQAGLSPATAYFAFTPPKPFTGRLWSIRKFMLQATGAGPFASAALSNVQGALFITGQPGSALANLSQDAPNLDADVVSFTLPTVQYFSTHQLWLRGTDSLVVAIQGTGVTQGLQIWGHARVVEIDDSPEFLLAL
jgi:hypothetical protein